jgi:hypothetical protein
MIFWNFFEPAVRRCASLLRRTLVLQEIVQLRSRNLKLFVKSSKHRDKVSNDEVSDLTSSGQRYEKSSNGKKIQKANCKLHFVSSSIPRLV